MPLRKGGPKSVRRGGVDDKPKFRPMQHKFHDEPEWHLDNDNDYDDKDELESVMSNNYNMMM